MRREALAATVSLLLVSPLARARIVERILAVVDDEVVLLSEVAERERPLRPQLEAAQSQMEREAMACRLRREVVESIVGEKLLERQARKLHLSVTTREIDRAVDGVRIANRLSEAEFAEALSEQGFSVAQYRSEVRRQLLELKVLNARVAGRVNVTDADVRDEYNRTVRDLRARDPFRGAMIFLAVPEGAGAVASAAKRAAAADLVRRARADEDFAALARAHSEDSATAVEGGDLGIRVRGELVPYLDDAFIDMAPGEVRGPVRAPGGWAVLKLLEREQTGVRSFEETKDGIRQELIEREMVRQRRLFLAEQKRQTYIDVRVDCG